MKASRIVILVVGVAMVLLGIAWALLRSDTVPDAKASFMTMTQTLSPARAAADKCWSERRIGLRECETLKSLLSTASSTNVVYRVTEDGALTGVDRSNQVTVVLTPRVEGNELTWRCAGSPPEAVAKLCDAHTAASR